MTKNIIARNYYSDTTSELTEDGYWKVIATIKDAVLYEGETEWVEEKVEAMSVDKDRENALQTVMNSTISYIIENVYNRGFVGLVEYREYERELEKAKNDTKTKDIQDS